MWIKSIRALDRALTAQAAAGQSKSKKSEKEPLS